MTTFTEDTAEVATPEVPAEVRVVAAMIGATSVLEFAQICEDMSNYTNEQRPGKDADQLNYLQGYAEALEDASKQARMFAEGLLNASHE